ncbi:MAG: hypothetical protein ACFCVD_12485 [Nodosilinea sp.]
MDTLFISEDFITPFKFWNRNQIVTGMQFRNELFYQVLTAPIKDRDRFFQDVDRLNPDASDMVITASKYHYTAWVNLRSPMAQRLFSAESPWPVPES